MIYKFYHKAQNSHTITTYETSDDNVAINVAKLIGNVIVVTEEGKVIYRGYETLVNVNFYRKEGKGYASCKLHPPDVDYIDGEDLYKWIKEKQNEICTPDKFVITVEHDGVPFMWRLFQPSSN